MQVMISDSADVDPEKLRALEDELPLDEVFGALSDRYVRYTIYYLYDGPDAISLDRLADVITAWDATLSGTVATRSDRDRTCVVLHRVVLPELDSLGYLTYDGRDTGAESIRNPDVPASVLSLLGVERN
jgi:hypothetical protein